MMRNIIYKTSVAVMLFAGTACLFSCGYYGKGNGKFAFSKWQKINEARVYENYYKSPDNTHSAERLDLVAGQGFYYQINEKFSPGDKLRLSGYFGGIGEPEMSIQIINYCTAAQSEMTEVNLKLTVDLKQYVAEHTFQYPQECARIQIILTSVDNMVKAWNPVIETVHNKETMQMRGDTETSGLKAASNFVK